MGEFEQKLGRLKEALALTEDQEIAAALGMTKASFSDRKRRDSFPDERVVGLKGKHPDLDVTYVLLGRQLDGVAAAQLERMFDVSAGMSDDIQRAAVDAARAAVADFDERQPLVRSITELLPWCSVEDMELLTRLVARLASSKPKARPASRKAPTTAATALAGSAPKKNGA